MIVDRAIERALPFLLRSLLPAQRAPRRDVTQPNFRGDGHDQDRINAAKAKRERRRQRNLRNYRRGGWTS
jgi:hypothetical protein